MALDPNAALAQSPAPMGGGGVATPGGGGVDAQKNILNDLVKTLMTRVSQPKMGMPAPQPKFSEESMTDKGFNMSLARSRGEDVGIALQNMGSMVHNLTAEHKRNQVRDAMSDWQGFDNAIEKAQLVAGDPSAPDYQQKVQAALGNMPWVKAMLDPANQKNVKRLKNMYKALNTDLMDEKENVYGAALKQHHKVKAAEKKITDVNQQADMAKKRQQTIQSRLANLMQQSKMSPPDPKGIEEVGRIAVEHEKNMVEAARLGIDKWEFKQGVGSDGKTPQWFALDKTHPDQPARPVGTMGPDGVEKPLSAVQKANPKAGSVLSVGGIPYAVYNSEGKLLTPKDPEFATDLEAQRHYSAANQAAAVSEMEKEKLAGIRAQTYMNSREYGVIAAQDLPELGIKAGDMRMVGPAIINKYASAFAPVGGAAGAMQKEAVFLDINRQTDNFDAASKALKHGIDPRIRAQMILAERSADPGAAIGTFFSQESFKGLAPDVQDYLLAHSILVENAMAIRGIAGMGQGAQDLRDAIIRALPGVAPINQRVTDKQIDLFRGMVDRLHTGVPGVIKKDNLGTPPATAPTHSKGALPD
jgi:hypothetical protein